MKDYDIRQFYEDLAFLIVGVGFGFALCTMAFMSHFSNLPFTIIRFPLFFFDVALAGLLVFVILRRKKE